MDRFIKTKSQKTVSGSAQELSDAGAVCFWGPPGIGKTHLVEMTRGIWLTEDVLRSKQGTLDFIARVRSADRPVIIDDFESLADLVGLRELTGPPSRAQLFITARNPVKLHFPVLNQEYPTPSPEKIEKIIFLKKPEADPVRVRELIGLANGSVRFVLQGIEFNSDAPDNFQEPKHDLEVLFAKGVKGVRPTIGTLHEHGYSWAVVQEIYPDGPNLNMDDIADIAAMMSVADLIDENIYRTQNWDQTQFFIVEAVFRPALVVKKTLKKLRPGSLWTKFQNYCMKRKKLEGIYKKIGTNSLDMLPLVALKADEYPQLTPQDVTFMKKICSFK
jgi:hypothetical protein